MEDVLDVYERQYDPQYPVVCMDEQPVQLIDHTRQPLAMKPGRKQRYDHEYRRNGRAVNFMFCEPLGSWRKVSVRQSKKMVDWAEEIRELVDVDYPEAKKVVLVCDNLNTHKIASLYERFSPDEARRLGNRLEIHYTPKHGSWLNVAEIELSLLTRMALNHRMVNVENLHRQSQAWANRRNNEQQKVDCQFRTANARIKLKRLYPEYKSL